MKHALLKIMLFIIAILVVILITSSIWQNSNVSVPNRVDIDIWIDSAGFWGPMLIVTLMALAIVASPIPSAPIALAAGAAYGHFFGTLLVIAGAELGALAAFAIARKLGRAFVEKHIGRKLDSRFLGSQNTLTLLIFVSRLLPFLSFDIISYAAGLSSVRFWRFSVATLAGILPASFLLAHLGSQAMNENARMATWTAVAIGGFTITTFSLAIWRDSRRSKK